jgi:hypothetical protein
MVRALIRRAKSQTRRIVTPRNSTINGSHSERALWNMLDMAKAKVVSPEGMPGPYFLVFGDRLNRVYSRICVGDTLWVRETWGVRHIFETTYPDCALDAIAYRASCPKNLHDKCLWGDPLTQAVGLKRAEIHAVQRWRPSIHMAKRFARIELTVERLGAGRLQDISENDAIAEGLQQHPASGDWIGAINPIDGDHTRWPTPRRAFESIWDSINGHRPEASWADNPLVWTYYLSAPRRPGRMSCHTKNT